VYVVDTLDKCDGTIPEFPKSLVEFVGGTMQPPPIFLLLSRHILLSQIDDYFGMKGGALYITRP